MRPWLTQGVSCAVGRQELRPRDRELLCQHVDRRVRLVERERFEHALVRGENAQVVRRRILPGESPVSDRDHGLDHRSEREPGAEEEATPAELEDAPVKRDVELDEALGRRSLAPDRLEGRRDRRDIRANRGSATDGRRLELEADREEVTEILGLEVHRDHSPIRQGLDETLTLQDLERTANRPSADGQLRGELVLHEWGSGRKGAVDDRLAKCARDPSRIDAPGELDGVLAGASELGQRISENS